jgi:hypothetical protein
MTARNKILPQHDIYVSTMQKGKKNIFGPLAIALSDWTPCADRIDDDDVSLRAIFDWQKCSDSKEEWMDAWMDIRCIRTVLEGIDRPVRGKTTVYPSTTPHEGLVPDVATRDSSLA